MPSRIRRVVTGKDANGKAVVLMDSPAPNVRVRKETGATATFLWLTDSIPASIAETTDPVAQRGGIAPPPNGTVFRVVEFAPERDIQADYQTRLEHTKELGIEAEGATRDRPRHPGMHRTRTLDYAVILSGEIDMLLDDTDVHLNAGDVVIQQGTNHAWVNRGHAPCKVAFILIDAKE